MTAHAFGRFFVPGPTDVHPDVLAAMQHAMIGHRSSAMERLLEGLEQPLARLFRTLRTVLVGTTSATGFMELAVRRSEEHTSELQSQSNLVCRLLLEKKKKKHIK